MSLEKATNKMTRLQETLKTRIGKVDDLVALRDKVDLSKDKPVAQTEAYKTKRAEVVSNIAKANYQVKQTNKKIDDLFKEFPDLYVKFGRVVPDDTPPLVNDYVPPEKTEDEKRAELKALSKPMATKTKEAIKEKVAGFGLPPELKPAPVVDEPDTVEIVDKIVDEVIESVPSDEIKSIIPEIETERGEVKIANEKVVDTSHMKDSSHNVWMQETGNELLRKGFSIRSIAGVLVHKFGQSANLGLSSSLINEAVEFFPHNIGEQIRHIYTRLED